MAMTDKNGRQFSCLIPDIIFDDEEEMNGAAKSLVRELSLLRCLMPTTVHQSHGTLVKLYSFLTCLTPKRIKASLLFGCSRNRQQEGPRSHLQS